MVYVGVSGWLKLFFAVEGPGRSSAFGRPSKGFVFLLRPFSFFLFEGGGGGEAVIMFVPLQWQPLWIFYILWGILYLGVSYYHSAYVLRSWFGAFSFYLFQVVDTTKIPLLARNVSRGVPMLQPTVRL